MSPMKTAPLVLALMTLFTASIKANTEDQQIINAVTGIMDALSTDDTAKFDSLTSPDFYIFDGGNRFNGHTVVDVIKALHAAGKRFQWSVTEPDIHIDGDTAWIAYVNKGSITDASGTSKQNWLESGFFRKSDGNWKVVFLHSTRAVMKPAEKGDGK
jgi:ketosteroid isomerase-like protein